MPGISRYVINLAPDLSGSGRELPHDGFAEVWFESEEAMRLSGRSPEARVTLDDEQNLFRPLYSLQRHRRRARHDR